MSRSLFVLPISSLASPSSLSLLFGASLMAWALLFSILHPAGLRLYQHLSWPAAKYPEFVHLSFCASPPSFFPSRLFVSFPDPKHLRMFSIDRSTNDFRTHSRLVQS